MVGYGLILFMVLFAIGLIAYRGYHTHQRTYRRRQRNEQRDYEARQASRLR